MADGGDDPRRRFAETLIDALDAFDAPIVVYSAYEQTRLKELAGQFPDLGAALNADYRPAGYASGLEALVSRICDQCSVAGW